MTLRDYLYRAVVWLKHRFRARNTLGYGVHSPFLYYIISMLIYDKNAYYAFPRIEKRRAVLLRNKQPIEVLDYGTGRSGMRIVGQIAATSVSNRREGEILFKLVNYLQPDTIVELGTSLGITTAYLASPRKEAHVITFEGSDAVAEIAKETFDRLELNNIEVINGNIDDSLASFLRDSKRVDFAFLDANHTEDATMRYFGQLVEKGHGKTVIVVDDIHYSISMGKAWKQIRRHKKVTATFDCYDMGIVFFDEHLPQKTYILNL